MKDQNRVQFDSGTSGILGHGKLFQTKSLTWAAMLFIVVLAFFFASVFGATWLSLHGLWAYGPALFLPIISCWIYAVLVRRFERRTPQELAGISKAFSQGTLGFVFGALFIGSMWLLLFCCKLYTAHRGVWAHWFDDLVFDSYISAVLEELAFRAVLLRIFSRLWGIRKGVIFSSVLFGLAHLTHHSWLGVFGIMLNGGITMGLLYVITGRLWMSIGMHLGYDFVETSILGIGSEHAWLVSQPRTDAAAWLTGGSFGPDAAFPAIALGLVLNVVLWRLAFLRHRSPSLSVVNI